MWCSTAGYLLFAAIVTKISCDCGIPTPNTNLNVTQDGIGAETFPWVVFIYEDTNGSLTKCAYGNLISSDVVITAAVHIGIRNPAIWYVSEKYDKSYRIPYDSIPMARVKAIHVARAYNTSSEYDPPGEVAWLVLDRPLNVTPACIDLQNRQDMEQQLPVGLVGRIFYWDSEDGRSKFKRMEIIESSHNDCYNFFLEEVRQNMSVNPPCARFLEGYPYLFEQIGSGFYSQRNGRWYLRAIITDYDFRFDVDRSGIPNIALIVYVQRFADQMYRSGAIKRCGTILPVNTLMVGGGRAGRGGYPWHVAVYEKNTTGFHNQICGGSLISSNIVASAAHCFYDDNIKQQRDASNFAVAAGKQYRPYYWPERLVQKSHVQTIHIPNRYYGIDGLYAADIAWLILQHPFDLSANIKPICLEPSSENESEDLLIGQVGRVAGWGLTEDGFSSHELKEMTAPFVRHEECISAFPPYSRPLVTPDKFCAGRLNGTTLCNGDSGGGLAFQRDGRWYLLGIVSVNPVVDTTCYTHTYTAFTNVKRYYNELYRFTNLTTNDLI